MKPRRRPSLILKAALFGVLASQTAFSQPPPVLETLYPSGGRAGTSLIVQVTGANLGAVTDLRSNLPAIRSEKIDASHFRLHLPTESLPGQYDLWVLGPNGLSSPRRFEISRREEVLEVESADAAPQPVPVDSVINGRIEKPGDADRFRFKAKKGQRVVLDCVAERIDSRLRAVLEVTDETGRRLAVHRGAVGVDPMIDLTIPADGAYVATIKDLVASGAADYYYRLEVDTQPRIAYCQPAVVTRGKASRVKLWGWNLPGAKRSQAEPPPGHPRPLDSIEWEIPASMAEPGWPLPFPKTGAESAAEDFALRPFENSRPVRLSVTELPVTVAPFGAATAASAQRVAVPCEVAGTLEDAGTAQWFSFSASSGEVFHFETYGQRIGSPVDMTLRLYDSRGQRELVAFHDETRNLGGLTRTDHLDPCGRWVCPADGQYHVALINLTSGPSPRLPSPFRLSIRREEPQSDLLALSENGPLSLNIPAGGRERLEIVAFRRRGDFHPIRVTAQDLPAGLECPDVWIGPHSDRTTLVVSASRSSAGLSGNLHLVAIANRNSGSSDDSSGHGSPVRGATVTRNATPIAGSRLVSQIGFAVTGPAALIVTADSHVPLEHHLYGKLPARHAPGGFVDVAVRLDRGDVNRSSPVRLKAIGLPDSIPAAAAIVLQGESSGWISFALPRTLPVGRFSFAVRAETTIPNAEGKPTPLTVVSNPMTIDVQPAAFLVEADPFLNPKVRRGETIQVSYAVQRIHGFIGKTHTELAAPGRITDVVGLRGRGETFTGQTEKGSLQIVVNDDAPLGRQPYLRLLTVGVVEDEPLYLGGCFLPLEIVE